MYFNQDSIHPDSLRVKSYIEGPHIKWRSNSRIEVFYIKHDSLKNRTRKISKSFRFKKDIVEFKGFAGSDTLTYQIPRTYKPAPSIHQSNSKIIVLGDIHGEYHSLIKLLQNNQVIDENLNWICGDGHLVFTGDVFDRGEQVTECLWLIFRLEMQAKKQGGTVHYLLGNHELMALLYDTRYVNDKYLHACHFLKDHYSNLFDIHSVLGRWLRSKNTIEKVGKILFVHGGISPKFLEKKLSMDKVNQKMRYHINQYMELQDTSLADLFFYTHSPVWYRGYLSRTPSYNRISLPEVIQTLNFYDAMMIVFGHTPVSRVYPFYSYKLIAMDVPIGDPDYEDQALLIEDQKFFRIFTDRKKERL
jgi:hypothetical protein